MSVRPITDTLRLLQGGLFLDSCSDLLAETVKQVDETGKAGKLTITLDLTKSGGAIAIAAKVTNKAPEKKPDAIDGSVAAFEADHPPDGEGEGTDLFAQTSGEGDASKPDSNIPDEDPFYPDAVALVRAKKRASISLVQREFQIGYNRAARLFERMQAEGVVSAEDAEGNRAVIGASEAPQGEGAPAGSRTARGRAKTQAALADGLAAAGAAS